MSANTPASDLTLTPSPEDVSTTVVQMSGSEDSAVNPTADDVQQPSTSIHFSDSTQPSSHKQFLSDLKRRHKNARESLQAKPKKPSDEENWTYGGTVHCCLQISAASGKSEFELSQHPAYLQYLSDLTRQRDPRPTTEIAVDKTSVASSRTAGQEELTQSEMLLLFPKPPRSLRQEQP